ncbi:MAG TPA: DUF805 domain-containing protein [Paenalcaligenes sp.]|nr:DUF805 domain-containing protein [Paenalcaligenes sp.]
MQWYLSVLQKYAVFTGRARRKEYWFFLLFNIIIFFILSLIDNMLGTFNAQTGVGVLSSIYWLAILIPSIAVGIRRLHDTGRTGWWLLLVFIPVIGPLIILVLMLLDSQPGTNQYGTNPKGT